MAKPFDGAVSARPSPDHPGGTIYIFADGHSILVYGGKNAADRSNSPAIDFFLKKVGDLSDPKIQTKIKQMISTYGAIGYTFTELGAGQLVFADEAAALSAAKRVLDAYNVNGSHTVLETLRDHYNAKGNPNYQAEIKKYFKGKYKYILNKKYNDLTVDERNIVLHNAMQEEGFYGSATGTIVEPVATPTGPMWPEPSAESPQDNADKAIRRGKPGKTPSEKHSDATQDRLRELYDAFLRRDIGLNTLHYLAGFYPGSVAGDEAADRERFDAFSSALTAYLEHGPEIGRTMFGLNGSEIADDNTKTATILSFLRSSEGRTWTASRDDADEANRVATLPVDLGASAIGRQILDDPEMMALVVDISRQPGGSDALQALLLGDVAASVKDAAATALAEHQSEDGSPKELRRLILRQMSESGSAEVQPSELSLGTSQADFVGLSSSNANALGAGFTMGSNTALADDRLAQLLGLGGEQRGIGWAVIDASDRDRPGRIRLFGDDSQDGSTTDTRNTVPERTPSSDTQPAAIDIREISRQVMRQIAEEGNRPPRGIMVDPTVTPPLAGYAMFGP